MHVNMTVSVSAVATISRHDVIAMQWFSHKLQAMNNFMFRIIFLGCCQYGCHKITNKSNVRCDHVSTPCTD